MDSTAISMEYSDSISMEAMANYAMASIEEVEFYRIPWKSWNLIWLRIDLTAEKMATETFILNPIFIKNVVKKLL